MVKRIAAIVLALGVSLLVVSSNQADTKNFVVSATIPTATGVIINPSRVNSSNGQFTPVSGLALSFNPMTLNTAAGIYLPDHFFAIDVAAAGGAGTPNVTVTYNEGTNPNGTGKGLGWKSTATFIKVTGATGSQTESPLTTHGPKKLLKDLTGESITKAQIAGGFLRIYVGIFTGDPAATYPDPVTGQPFTNADAPGTYDGTLIVTATLT